ncbi:MAG: DUF4058 family protein [Isosphaeraceae bacterium]
MHSPFPGIDPYIEAFGLWEDFQSKLIGEMERTLSSLVPDRYVETSGLRPRSGTLRRARPAPPRPPDADGRPLAG